MLPAAFLPCVVVSPTGRIVTSNNLTSNCYFLFDVPCCCAICSSAPLLHAAGIDDSQVTRLTTAELVRHLILLGKRRTISASQTGKGEACDCGHGVLVALFECRCGKTRRDSEPTISYSPMLSKNYAATNDFNFVQRGLTYCTTKF